jgi:hypothetical protein
MFNRCNVIPYASYWAPPMYRTYLAGTGILDTAADDEPFLPVHGGQQEER